MTASGLPIDPLDPTSITALLGAVFYETNSGSARSQQREIGMSQLGSCRRQAAYQHFGVEPDPDFYDEKRAAQLGTWLHEGLLPRLSARLPGSAYEIDVELKLDGLSPIPGHVDLYWPLGKQVIDVKTRGPRSMDWVLSRGIPRKEIWQTHGYAQAIIDSGREVESICILNLNRDNGEVVPVVMPFDPTQVELLAQWWAEVCLAENAEQLPRDERGPGLSYLCDHCPWLHQCWGAAAIRGTAGAQALPRDVVAGDITPVIEACSQWVTATETERAASKEKEFLRQVLQDVPDGSYGDYELTWRKGRSTVDNDAVKDEYARLGRSVPMKEGRPWFSVKRKKLS